MGKTQMIVAVATAALGWAVGQAAWAQGAEPALLLGDKLEHDALQAGMQMAVGFVQQHQRTRVALPQEAQHAGELEPTERQERAIDEGMLRHIVLEQYADATWAFGISAAGVSGTKRRTETHVSVAIAPTKTNAARQPQC